MRQELLRLAIKLSCGDPQKEYAALPEVETLLNAVKDSPITLGAVFSPEESQGFVKALANKSLIQTEDSGAQILRSAVRLFGSAWLDGRIGIVTFSDAFIPLLVKMLDDAERTREYGVAQGRVANLLGEFIAANPEDPKACEALFPLFRFLRYGGSGDAVHIALEKAGISFDEASLLIELNRSIDPEHSVRLATRVGDEGSALGISTLAETFGDPEGYLSERDGRILDVLVHAVRRSEWVNPIIYSLGRLIEKSESLLDLEDRPDVLGSLENIRKYLSEEAQMAWGLRSLLLVELADAIMAGSESIRDGQHADSLGEKKSTYINSLRRKVDYARAKASDDGKFERPKGRRFRKELVHMDRPQKQRI